MRKKPEMKPSALHKVHASPASGKGGVSFDLGPFRWRPESGAGSPELARAMAYRIAFTWNMAEGIPLPSLEAGAVANYYAAVRDLLEEIGEVSQEDAPQLHAAVQRVIAAYGGHKFDFDGGCQCKTPKR